MMRSQLILSLADPLPDDAILTQGTAKPILRGYDPNGFDYICGRCREMVLAEQVSDGEIWNVLIECFSCGGLSAAPTRPRGVPLPAQRIVLLPGRHPVLETINSEKGAVIVGKQANDERESEIGAFLQGGLRPCRSELDLRAMIEEARSLLPDVFDELYERELRGQRSRTPPKNRHRLMALATEILSCAESFRSSKPKINMSAVGEFNMVLGLFSRWQKDPAWPQIQSSLRNPTDFPHAMITLAVASHLNDIGNGAGLVVVPKSGRRNADIRIVVSAMKSALLEVKAPLHLQKSNRQLDSSMAERIITKALREAGTGENGQLGPHTPGILLVGGFHLTDLEMKNLERASRKILASDSDSRRHISGIAVLTIRVIVEGNETGSCVIESMEKLTAKSVISYGVAVNPNYDGAIALLFPTAPNT